MNTSVVSIQQYDIFKYEEITPNLGMGHAID